MEPDRGGRGLEAGQALGEEAGRDAGEDVAGAGGGEPRRGVGVDREAAVGGGDAGVRALEDEDGTRAGGGGAGALGPRGSGEVGEEPAELALVR